MKNLSNCRTLSVNLTAVYHATVTAGHATAIIPDAGTFVSCGDIFVTGVHLIVYGGSRADTAAGTIFCHAAPIFRCDEAFVCLHGSFVNEARRFLRQRSASVNASDVYFNGRSTFAGPICTIYYGTRIHVNATRVYFSVRSTLSNAAGIYFRCGSEACSTSAVFNSGGSVHVKATHVYFTMKHSSDNDAGAFGKGKREPDKAARVYFAMKSVSGSITGAAGSDTGIKSSKSGGHVPAITGIVLQGNSPGRQSATNIPQRVVTGCNTAALAPDIDTPDKGWKTEIYLSFTSATAYYTFNSNCSAVVFGDSNKR